ncbi:MAG: acetyl-CoA carboxylase biotin carboxyl carrier protein [Thermoanaerobaculia bacterium]|nr:MAG: acetyl-CoA carboxylase biotin carboxyl carrier protein [Thermoanaerobaculia bacterium]MBZ0101619.1 acetyl-CoA carboxylase biotin carboxyl carrier protein [Thermoanaerobaculia bacterium]
MLTFEQIKELVELVASRRLHALELERAGFTLRISGEQTAVREVQIAAPAVAAATQPAAVATPAPAPVAAAAASAAAAPRTDLHVVTSPIVGTFYAAPSPDSPSFVKPGDRVRKGQVLCIVEAMKLMNEIECDADGVVAEIYPKNGQPVEYGEALFGLERD